MAHIVVRPMVLADFPAFDYFDAALHAMHQQARPDLLAPCGHLFTQAEFTSMLESPGQVALLAEDGPTPVGICMGRGRCGQGPARSRETRGGGKGGRPRRPYGMAL